MARFAAARRPAPHARARWRGGGARHLDRAFRSGQPLLGPHPWRRRRVPHPGWHVLGRAWRLRARQLRAQSARLEAHAAKRPGCTIFVKLRQMGPGRSREGAHRHDQRGLAAGPGRGPSHCPFTRALPSGSRWCGWRPAPAWPPRPPGRRRDFRAREQARRRGGPVSKGQLVAQSGRQRASPYSDEGCVLYIKSGHLGAPPTPPPPRGDLLPPRAGSGAAGRRCCAHCARADMPRSPSWALRLRPTWRAPGARRDNRRAARQSRRRSARARHRALTICRAPTGSSPANASARRRAYSAVPRRKTRPLP